MSVLLMGKAFYTDLPSHLRLTLLALCDVASDDGGNIHIGQKHLGLKIGASDRSVRENVGKLVELGYLTPISRTGPRGVNRYLLNVDLLPTDADIADSKAILRAEDSADRKPTSAIDRKPTSAIDRKPTSGKPLDNPLDQSLGLIPPRSFDEFYQAYPRHEHRAAAERAWNKAIRRAEPVDIIAGALRYRNDPNREDRYTAHPATWLNADGWLDDPLPGKPDRARQLMDAAAAMREGVNRGSGRDDGMRGVAAGRLPSG